MTKKILIIDDIRSDGDIGYMWPNYTEGQTEPDYSCLIARTYTLGIQALEFMGPWDHLYLDHDFGDPQGKNGYNVLCWIEEQMFNYKFALVPSNMTCISSNGAGVSKINQGWEAIQKRLPELMEEYIQQYKTRRGIP